MVVLVALISVSAKNAFRKHLFEVSNFGMDSGNQKFTFRQRTYDWFRFYIPSLIWNLTTVLDSWSAGVSSKPVYLEFTPVPR